MSKLLQEAALLTQAEKYRASSGERGTHRAPAAVSERHTTTEVAVIDRRVRDEGSHAYPVSDGLMAQFGVEAGLFEAVKGAEPFLMGGEVRPS